MYYSCLARSTLACRTAAAQMATRLSALRQWSSLATDWEQHPQITYHRQFLDSTVKHKMHSRCRLQSHTQQHGAAVETADHSPPQPAQAAADISIWHTATVFIIRIQNCIRQIAIRTTNTAAASLSRLHCSGQVEQISVRHTAVCVDTLHCRHDVSGAEHKLTIHICHRHPFVDSTQ
jgi:hypothetical protein